jgi:hypothetical protein
MAWAYKSMSLIEEIKTRLRNYHDAKYESDGESVSVLPISNDGFTVSLTEQQGSYLVSFGGWHEAFKDKEEALNCFAFGLSSECRLKEVRRGSFAYKWTVEAKENERWVEDGTTGLYLFPFWKKKEVRYLQNHLIGEEAAPIQSSHPITHRTRAR